MSDIPSRLVLPARVWSLKRGQGHDRMKGQDCIHITRDFAEVTDGHLLVRQTFTTKEKAQQKRYRGIPPAGGICIRLRPQGIASCPGERDDTDGEYIQLQKFNNCLVDTQRVIVAELVADAFPDTQGVLDALEDQIEASVNPSLLSRAADALGASTVVLKLGRLPEYEKGVDQVVRPFIVEGLNGSLGIGMVMPLRSPEK